MPKTVKWSKSSIARVDGGSQAALFGKLAQQYARGQSSTLTDLTDSSGGVAAALTNKSKRAVPNILADLVNVANAGGNLASGATALAALDLVKDGILELAVKANAVAAKVGVTPLTYNGGGTAADGTIAAIGLTTAAATGALAPQTNASLIVLRSAIYNVAHLVNACAAATGTAELDIDLEGTKQSIVPAIANAVGAAASPGVTKAALDAKLTQFAAVIATLAATLNAMTADSAAIPEIVVVA